MKQILLLLLSLGCACTGQSQYGYSYRAGGARNLYLGFNFKLGAIDEDVRRQSATGVYPMAVRSSLGTGNIDIDNGISSGFDFQIGYFFSDRSNWGLGTGLIFLRSTGNLTMDPFRVEFASTDERGDVFRQMISSNGTVRENIKTRNWGLPVLVKFRTDISDFIGFSIDAGAVFNLAMRTSYQAVNRFDYEAVYRFTGTGDNVSTVYDNAPTPQPDSWIITREQFERTHPGQDAAAYFQLLRAQGYRVALDQEVRGSGRRSANSSPGFLVQPSFNFKLGEGFRINVGGYYMRQSFKYGASQDDMQLTNEIGAYNTLLYHVRKRTHEYYGVNIGFSLHL